MKKNKKLILISSILSAFVLFDSIMLHNFISEVPIGPGAVFATIAFIIITLSIIYLTVAWGRLFISISFGIKEDYVIKSCLSLLMFIIALITSNMLFSYALNYGFIESVQYCLDLDVNVKENYEKVIRIILFLFGQVLLLLLFSQFIEFTSKVIKWDNKEEVIKNNNNELILKEIKRQNVIIVNQTKEIHNCSKEILRLSNDVNKLIKKAKNSNH